MNGKNRIYKTKYTNHLRFNDTINWMKSKEKKKRTITSASWWTWSLWSSQSTVETPNFAK